MDKKIVQVDCWVKYLFFINLIHSKVLCLFPGSPRSINTTSNGVSEQIVWRIFCASWEHKFNNWKHEKALMNRYSRLVHRTCFIVRRFISQTKRQLPLIITTNTDDQIQFVSKCRTDPEVKPAYKKTARFYLCNRSCVRFPYQAPRAQIILTQ